MWDYLSLIWPSLLTVLVLAVDLTGTCHAILRKRDPRSALAWIGLIWLVPFFGALLYAWLGINRIQRRARLLRSRPGPAIPGAGSTGRAVEFPVAGENLRSLARLVVRVTGQPLLGGNRVEVLEEDPGAYAVMLEAIERARASLALSTYIFDNDRAGRMFLEALAGAVARGVAVRVIIDDVGTRYRWPPIVKPLRRAGVPVARFLPKVMPWAFRYANLRNHRKIMVVDGRIGFTGGMNIREGHWPALRPRHPIRDLHFRVQGPVVAQLQRVFAEDWLFCTGEVLEGECWSPKLAAAGEVFARGIPDGPDEDFDKLRLTLLGALACARSSVRIVTPYFLPDAALITALNVAALRGVEVDILLPQRNNLRLVQWASTAMLWQVLERGCRVWLTPPPFDHTKLMVVDGAWSLIGSTNWDPRSLRLNFEFNLECYDRELAGRLEGLALARTRQARRLTLAEVDGRSLPVRLRDGAARLLSPHL